MANKDLLRLEIELELGTVVSNLEESIKSVVKRLGDLKQYEGSGSIEGNDLEMALEAGLHVQRRQENPNSMLAIVMNYIKNPEKRKCELSMHEMQLMKAELEKTLAETNAIHAVVDELEERFRKYNLPKRGSCESLEPYLAKVREFMRDVWREMAEKSSQKGYKCLMEWMVKLDQSSEAERRMASKTIRAALVEIGIEISRLLVEYLWMILVFAELGEMAERLLEVDTVIRCLSIEEEGSVVIESFASVVEFFHRTMRFTKRAKPEGRDAEGKSVEENSEDAGVEDSPWIEKEAELFHLIIIEILRLEVSFRSPDLPMILLSPMYVLMGEHLMENVFKDKLNAIKVKMKDLKTQSRRQSITDFFEEILKSGIKEIWSRLDICAKN